MSSSQKELTSMDWSKEENGNLRPKGAPCNPQGAFLVRQNMADRLQSQVRERHASNSAQCQLGFFYMLLRCSGQAKHWDWHFLPTCQRLDHFLIPLSLQKQGLITFLPSGFFTFSSQRQVWLLIYKSLCNMQYPKSYHFCRKHTFYTTPLQPSIIFKTLKSWVCLVYFFYYAFTSLPPPSLNNFLLPSGLLK